MNDMKYYLRAHYVFGASFMKSDINFDECSDDYLMRKDLWPKHYYSYEQPEKARWYHILSVTSPGVCHLHINEKWVIMVIGPFPFTSVGEESIVRMWRSLSFSSCTKTCDLTKYALYRVPPPPKKKKQQHGTVDFFALCSDQMLSFFTLLDRASFPHYNNTNIIKFGWELFILWVISYGLSFSGFAINCH